LEVWKRSNRVPDCTKTLKKPAKILLMLRRGEAVQQEKDKIPGPFFLRSSIHSRSTLPFIRCSTPLFSLYSHQTKN